MSLRYHVNSIQTGRLVELYENAREHKYEVHHIINGKRTVYPCDSMMTAYQQYNKLAAL